MNSSTDLFDKEDLVEDVIEVVREYAALWI